jgi:hypothetical protein
MTGERTRKNDSVSAGDESDRPTITPPYDMEAFARRASSQDETEPQSGRTTVTNVAELEEARRRSAESAESGRFSSVPVRFSSVPSDPRTPLPSSIEGAIGAAIEAMAGPTLTERAIDDPFVEMHAYLESGDHAQALELAELILADDPANQEARECRQRCRALLEKRYARSLGPLDRTPLVTPAGRGRDVQAIDHRAKFLLSMVDGAASLEEIVEGCGMPRLDALRILHELVVTGVIA